jgi:hypothetical protein
MLKPVMKQIHFRPLRPVGERIFKIFLPVLIFLVAGMRANAQVLVPELVFANPQLSTGPGCAGAGEDGAVYIFSNVGPDIDALVVIRGRSSSLVTLTSADLPAEKLDAANATGYDACWQPVVSYRNGRAPAHTSWWMEFKISFVKHDHPEQSVSVNQFFVSGLRIGGDGRSLHEFLSFYNTASFNLEGHSLMSAVAVRGCLADRQTSGNRFDGPTKKYVEMDLAGQDVMVNNFYSHTNSLILRVGAETGAGRSSSADRMYSLSFKSLTFDIPHQAALPITLIALNSENGNNSLNSRCEMANENRRGSIEKNNAEIDKNEF